jgi:hypothetical protein
VHGVQQPGLSCIQRRTLPLQDEQRADSLLVGKRARVTVERRHRLVHRFDYLGCQGPKRVIHKGNSTKLIEAAEPVHKIPKRKSR